jgi:L-alanine-DL-glutamate epimerase-like enolase superfamily enzyme
MSDAPVPQRLPDGARSDGPVLESVEVACYTVPTDAPEADGTIAWDSTTMVLVTASSGTTSGMGWTYGPASCGAVVSDLLAGVVTGRCAWDVPGSNEAMLRSVRNTGRPGIASYAISAVDIALWDLKARLLDLPLHHLLGTARELVPVYGSGGFTTYDDDQLAGQLSGWVAEQGIPRVKIKIGESWGTMVDRDLARMRQARKVIGEDAELFVDANGGYRAKQAIRVLQRADEENITWYEEPVSSDDLAGLAAVRAAVGADVAAGEYATDPTYARVMCAAGAVDCLQADVTRCGGITQWLRIAAVAGSFGLEVSGHCAPHAHAAVAATIPNLRHLEWFHDHVRIESMFFDGVLDPAGGVIRPDASAHGSGLTLRATDAERYRVG